MSGENHMESNGPCRRCLTPSRSKLRFAKYQLLPQVIFNSENTLSIEQSGQSDDLRGGHELHVSGRVDVCSNKLHALFGQVEIEIASDDKRLTAASMIKIDKQSVAIITPFAANWWDEEGLGPCVTIHISIYAPFAGELSALFLNVANLDVLFTEDLSLFPANRTTIITTSGNVYAPLTRRNPSDTVPYDLRSREICIHTLSGNVDGWFPLHHLLKIGTASGNVFIEVGLGSNAPDSASHAKLSVRTTSGKLVISTPQIFHMTERKVSELRPPARDYIVKLVTLSGNIEAKVVMASRATIRSTTGDIHVDVMPMHFSQRGDGKSHLETNTRSGRTEVFVLDPRLVHRTDHTTLMTTGFEATNTSFGLATLQSNHQSLSGNMKLHYAKSWTGGFSGETISGKILVRGQDIKITSPCPREAKISGASTGEGAASIRMGSNSGDLALYIGEM
ncbi:hypothetical protein E4U16_001914 [Claviceps sp. LM84 group G4]|nr:hypothetical protein E4U33_001272 [Claviceps sp. LM78 group G4]KAG6077954.1 hypothetical protein E4U16_001914 [Claviceps sp. LM84 group G4]